MTDLKARQIVVVSLAASGVLASVREIRQGHAPRVRILAGVFLSAVVLAMISEAAPDVAAGIALIVFVTAILTSGEVFDAVTNLLAAQASSGPPPSGNLGNIGK